MPKKVVKSAGRTRRMPLREPKKSVVRASASSAKALQKGTTVIEDKTIKRILEDPRFSQSLPCLASGKQALADLPKTCGRCHRKLSNGTKRVMQSLRQCIASLSGDQQQQFKRLLGSQKVTVVVSNGQTVSF